MKKLGLLLFLLTALAGCGRGEPYLFSVSDALAEVQAAANARRDGIVRPGLDAVDAWVGMHRAGEVDVFHDIFYLYRELNWRQLAHQHINRINVRGLVHGVWHDDPVLAALYEISQRRAIQDAELFFAALASSYGMYQYFGGDRVFLPMLAMIRSELTAQAYWYITDFKALLHSYLTTVIVDYHFSLERHVTTDGEFVSESVTFPGGYGVFMVDAAFDRGQQGFRNRANGRYVAAMRLPCRPHLTKEVSDFMRLSMDETGSSFYYTPVVIQSDRLFAAPQTLVIHYTDGTEESLALHLLDVYYRDPEPPALTFINDVPVVTVDLLRSHFGPEGYYPPNRLEAIQFLDFAVQLQGAPVLILDLRHNRGGLAVTPMLWYETLMGENIPASYVMFTLYNQTLREMAASANQSPESLLYRSFRPGEPLGAYHRISHYPPHRIVPNDQLIIVLTGRRTASAAERMVDMALNMRNTLIIGQNTAGIYMTGRNSWRPALPNSRIRFEFGMGITLFTDGHFREGVGFAPDIWVTGCALTAALGMIEHHVTTAC